MSLAQTKESQGLLFSEPDIAETGVWCQLSEGIDPENWMVSDSSILGVKCLWKQLCEILRDDSPDIRQVLKKGCFLSRGCLLL